MDLVYAVIFSGGVWRLYQGEAEVGAFSSFELAARAGQRAALARLAAGVSTELLLQDRFGELRSQRFSPEFRRRRDLVEDRAFGPPRQGGSPVRHVH